MGIDSRRKPPLPAPTESTTLQNSGDEIAATDLATDLSRRTDRTSYSIPEDGSPVTINTSKRHDSKLKDKDAVGRSSQASQTSLLIEYFEGGKGPNTQTRPSVRVKVTPSSSRKSKDSKNHIQITESSHRRPSVTRHISLGPAGQISQTELDEQSVSSLGDESSLVPRRRAPIDIEVMHKEMGSDLSGTSSSRDVIYNHNISEISSMPPDSMLEDHTLNKAIKQATATTPYTKGTAALVLATGLAAGVATRAGAAMLNTPYEDRSRSMSKERITQKVMEKLEKSREPTRSKQKHSSNSRSRSVSEEQLVETVSSPMRKSSKQHRVDEIPSGAESSLLSHSAASDKRRSADQYSIHSGTSKSSINNPKLLETVEDAIRRLILPELTALKENRSHQLRNRRDSSGSGTSHRNESSRKSRHDEEHSSRSKPRVVLNQDAEQAGTVLSGDSIKRKKTRRHEISQDSASERSFDRGVSEETVVRDGGRSSRKSSKEHKTRDTVAGGILGGILTKAALRSHDSTTADDRRERRRKHSKSHSRSETASETTGDIFQKHDIPPMPMASDITNSDLTRESILTERSSTPSSERRRSNLQDATRVSSKALQSPAAETPTRSPAGGSRGLGTYHDNSSRGNLALLADRGETEQNVQADLSGKVLYTGAAGAGLASMDRSRGGNAVEHYTHPRVLSPIQSVASFEEDKVHPNRTSFLDTQSTASLSSLGKDVKQQYVESVRSISSPDSIDQARLNRPRGINLESQNEILGQHQYPNSPRHADDTTSRDDDEDWYQQQHEENESYRNSMDTRDSTIDIKHLTNYTDDSMDAPYLDKVTAAQQIRGIGANAEYVHTPMAVESAVASLHDPSVLDVRSTQSGWTKLGAEVEPDSPTREYDQRGVSGTGYVNRRDVKASEAESHLQERYDDEQYHKSGAYEHGVPAESPRQSIAKSFEEEVVHMSASGIPDASHPMPAIGHGLESVKSDISTNPSIIRGPAGTIQPETAGWTHQSSTPKGNLARDDNGSAHDSLKAAAANMLAGAALARRQQKGYGTYEPDTSGIPAQDQTEIAAYQPDGSYTPGHLDGSYLDHAAPTPYTTKDEGYVSAANNPRSPVGYGTKGVRLFDDDGAGSLNDFANGDDPFVGHGQSKYVEGTPHGLSSPLYDSATGRGLDRIQSKDVVALMDHLTVRDAQRNARDTEILVTLVRSAAEMRNSFEDMKKFIADQDDMLIDVGEKQHARTVSKIGGPRPQVLGSPRTPRKAFNDTNSVEDKKKSVFRRALRGLGGRSTNDLARMEDMLEHLLNEVADLKAGRDPRAVEGLADDTYHSYDHMGDVAQDGYEPEGQAGTSSTGTGGPSGYFSRSPSYQQTRGLDSRRASAHRVSTVLEDDEDNEVLEEHEHNVLNSQFQRGGNNFIAGQENHLVPSTAYITPPRTQPGPTGAQSAEQTPKTSTEKSRRHKSSSSSFFPRISRWSKTTASSAQDITPRHSTQRRDRPISEVSRSDSEMNEVTDNVGDTYNAPGDDRLRSATSLSMDRPPSPLIPSQVSEKPTYHAHRDSLNLQHPQPRPGPTDRYQNHLESQAQNLGSPVSPSSDHFGSNPILSRFTPGGAGNRRNGETGTRSPVSETGTFSEVSITQKSAAPPRPPKIRDEGPLIPSKIPLDGRKPIYADRSLSMVETGFAGNGRNSPSGNPSRATGLLRKPTGPRPITTSGNYSPDKVAELKKTRYRGSPNHLSSDEDMTF